MRFGGPVDFHNPQEWIAALQASGYRAAYCPVQAGATDGEVRAYRDAAAQAGIVIAEVGAWGNNPLHPNPMERAESIRRTIEALVLAEEIGARCCVNVAGSRGERWDSPDPRNLDEDTFAWIVESVRAVLDAARPERTFYTLEPMPWTLPDSPASYLRLIKAVDRRGFAVHLDPANMVNCPERLYHSAAFLHECFDLLGPWIRSVHAKDVRLTADPTVRLEEMRPGLGSLDYPTLLREMSRLDRDTPFMLEHLHSVEEYNLAAQYVREIAGEVGVDL